jgi:hypothetical protein
MKSKTLFGILLIAFALTGVGVWAHKTFMKKESGAPTAILAPETTKMAVYYFHTTYRCLTCNNLEAYAKEAVEKAFSGELAKGEVFFASINVEEKAHEHFIEDYELKTKSVVLVAPGRADQWKNLDQIWQKVSDKQGYMHYIQQEARAFLLGLN